MLSQLAFEYFSIQRSYRDITVFTHCDVCVCDCVTDTDSDTDTVTNNRQVNDWLQCVIVSLPVSNGGHWNSAAPTADDTLQTGPSIPNYTSFTWPSQNSTHQLSQTLTKHHISQKSQLYINNARQEQTILNIPSSPTPQSYGTISPTSS